MASKYSFETRRKKVGIKSNLCNYILLNLVIYNYSKPNPEPEQMHYLLSMHIFIQVPRRQCKRVVWAGTKNRSLKVSASLLMVSYYSLYCPTSSFITRLSLNPLSTDVLSGFGILQWGRVVEMELMHSE